MTIDQTRVLLALLETAQAQNVSPEMAITLLQANINADHVNLPKPNGKLEVYVYERYFEDSNKLSAIKEISRVSGLGLKEAKEATEECINTFSVNAADWEVFYDRMFSYGYHVCNAGRL